ncbi:MAG: hypothetical protein ACYSRQ_03400 [Planctomycetota bacterium]|jgi:Na+/melibiose symporter-like transporter
MKTVGYILVIAGFLAGSLISVLHKTEVQWNWFAAVFIAGVIGLIFVRLTERKLHRSIHRVTSNMLSIEQSLDNIVKNMTQLNEEKASIDTYDMRHRIDELFIEDLNTFVEARQSIVHAHGLNTYAEVMSDFAAGERYLNRVWSASADGYIDEVNTYLEKAKIQFVETLNKIRNITK